MTKGFMKGVATVLAAGLLAGGICAVGYVSRDDNGKWFKESNIKAWSWTKTTTPEHKHTYDTEHWVKGSDSHWHAANCGHDLVIDVAPHTFDRTGQCTVCHQQIGSTVPLLLSTDYDNGIALASSLIALADYEEYGISQQAETAYTFTTTVLDENGTTNGVDQSVEVAAEWENAASAWANGKPVSAYVSVNQTGENTFTVSCLQAFSEPVLIKINSLAADVSAVKRCDYVKRVTDVNLTVSETDFDFTAMPNSYTATDAYGTGTVQGELKYTGVNVHFLDEFSSTIINSTYYKYFAQQCERAGIDFDWSQDFSVSADKALAEKDSVRFSWEEMFLCNMSAEDFQKVKNATNNCEHFKYAIIDSANHRVAPFDFTCTLSYTYTNNGIVYSNGFSGMCNVSISVAGLGKIPAITDIVTDPDGNIIF